MHSLSAALSLVALSCLLAPNFAQVADPDNYDSFSYIPTPPRQTIFPLPAQHPCQITINGIVFDTCAKRVLAAEASDSSSPPPSPPITSIPVAEGYPQVPITPTQRPCLVTVNGIVFNVCDGLWTFPSSTATIPALPRHTSDMPFQQGCLITAANGRVINICAHASTPDFQEDDSLSKIKRPAAAQVTDHDVTEQRACEVIIGGNVYNTCGSSLRLHTFVDELAGAPRQTNVKEEL